MNNGKSEQITSECERKKIKLETQQERKKSNFQINKKKRKRYAHTKNA